MSPASCFSLREATMMKVSHLSCSAACVKIFYKAFEKHEALFAELGINVAGMVDLYRRSRPCRNPSTMRIIRDLHACQEHRPKLAVVDSAKGHHNFHSPNDVIVDASNTGHDPPGRQDVGCRREAITTASASCPESTLCGSTRR